MSTAFAPLVRVHWHHPEWVAVAVATGGWLGLLVATAGEPAALLRGTHQPGVGLLRHAGLMAAAMMAPLVVVQTHALAVSSLWTRRYRAVVAYLAGYVAVWTAVGAMMMASVDLVRPLTGALLLVTATGTAAVAVASTEDHRRRLRRCGASRPLALSGWQADRDCVTAGVTMAGRCVATSWAVMLLVTAQGGVLVLAAGTVLVVAQRRGLMPDRSLVRGTLALVVAAVLAAAVGDATLAGMLSHPHSSH